MVILLKKSASSRGVQPKLTISNSHGNQPMGFVQGCALPTDESFGLELSYLNHPPLLLQLNPWDGELHIMGADATEFGSIQRGMHRETLFGMFSQTVFPYLAVQFKGTILMAYEMWSREDGHLLCICNPPDGLVAVVRAFPLQNGHCPAYHLYFMDDQWADIGSLICSFFDENNERGHGVSSITHRQQLHQKLQQLNAPQFIAKAEKDEYTSTSCTLL